MSNFTDQLTPRDSPILDAHPDQLELKMEMPLCAGCVFKTPVGATP